VIALVYSQFYCVGGISRYLDSFLENLPADMPSRPVLITSEENFTPRSYPGVEILHVPATHGRFDLYTWGSAVRRLLRELHRKGRIRWVNMHIPPLIPGLLLPPEIPVVLTAHTTYLGMSGRFYDKPYYESQWSAPSVFMKMWMERRILARMAKVITLTEQGRQEILSYGYKGPIAVIPNGADIVKFKPDESVRKDIDVLFSGRIETRKGSRSMLEACRAFIARRPGIRICIVGYGPDEQTVRDGLRDFSQNVHFTGRVPFQDMIGYYNRSRVYASTSFYEGLPGTCLEAMAMTLPAVVWKFPFYEGLVLDGETGYVAATNDFAAFSDRVFRLLDNEPLARGMGHRGRELLASRYSWRQLAADVVREFA
jgi:glycosyltransferase involved in cell wall biosynthesis